MSGMTQETVKNQLKPWELTPEELIEVRAEWHKALVEYENDKWLCKEVGDTPNYESMISARGQKKLTMWLRENVIGVGANLGAENWQLVKEWADARRN